MVPVSEQFLSHQGEGPFAGHYSVFLRTHACNLFCGAGKYAAGACWTCDTIPVFTKIQKRYTPDELLAKWRANGWLDALRNGAHLVITGGEPMMPERQRELIPFLELLNSHFPELFIETETNGTPMPLPEFDTHISHYNCSPKLANSGMPREQRYNPETIRWHRNSPKSIFKFVVASSEDIDELAGDFIIPFKIPASRVWLMPATSTRATLLEIGPLVAAMAARNGWNFSSRLHILLYDQTVSV